jgi:hypothetical protein
MPDSGRTEPLLVGPSRILVRFEAETQRQRGLVVGPDYREISNDGGIFQAKREVFQVEQGTPPDGGRQKLVPEAPWSMLGNLRPVNPLWSPHEAPLPRS